MPDPLFAPDFKETPYWWARTPRPALPESRLPAEADVAIIGSGYTGLCAAIQTARGGRRTLVFDAEDAGWGCSSRNGGQISTSLKPDFARLAAKHGAEAAFSILQEGHNALAWIGDFTADEGIDCDFKRVGRFHGAHTPAQYEAQARRLQNQPRGLEVEAHMVPRAEQRQEIGSDVYFGGTVLRQHASLDPGRYHQGLLERAQTAGATVIPHCKVTGFAREASGFQLTTARGGLKVRDIIVATSGYTGPLTPWQQRRVIPIGSYMIATEALAPEVMARLIPRDRVVSDSRKLVYYYRASPDRSRILFGGRVSLKETDPRASAPKLHGELCAIFPELAETRISHSWMGFVGYSFDTLPHVGRRDGAYYAMGYCGSGVSLASYLGTRVGQQLLGLPEGRTALDGLTFQTRPFYRGNPWFLAPTIRYYRWHDRRGRG